MVEGPLLRRFILFLIPFLAAGAAVHADPAGSIRGNVYDKEFDVPLAGAQVVIAENGAGVLTTPEGNYVFPLVEPGTFTLVFSKDGYKRQVKANVVVTAGQLTELDATLANEFTEMDEFIVQDIEISGASQEVYLVPGTESSLLQLRMESPAFMDSISSERMSQAGASDAAGALKLVAGASVQDGKYAVIRGLPDRYVNTQMNGFRLPTADASKRAVQLDQFPSAAIESVRVSKTFTPDQQGDASGGAVNVVLKGIPDETTAKVSSQVGFKTQVTGRDDFLSYEGGGVDNWGFSDRKIQTQNLNDKWAGAVGVSEIDAPIDSKWSTSAGGKHEFMNGLKFGGLGSFFYERNSDFYDDGVDDKYWVQSPGASMSPQYIQGTPSQNDFKTQLFDIKRSSEEVRWGLLGVLGMEIEDNKFTLADLYTHDVEDIATLAEDTRGKAYYFPDYNPYDSTSPGNLARDAAPYLRTETLEYTERTTQTVQLSGKHKLPDPEIGFGNIFQSSSPEIDWGYAHSSASLDQPDKRQFGALWWPESYSPGFPPYVPPSTSPAVFRPFKPAANFTLGNEQRIWKDILEESDQEFINAKLNFEQWSDDDGYFKFGLFHDETDRTYNQDSFSNFNDNSAQFYGNWTDSWSSTFPNETHRITAADIDVDYTGNEEITAGYNMLDLPLCSFFDVIGGARYENTELGIVNDPEKEVTWIPPSSSGQVDFHPGDADVAINQTDVLPMIGFAFKPVEKILTLRGSYSQTLARQTFKELTPIQQQDFLGGDVFIGNPELQISSLDNYDLRLDYTPYEGGLISLSYFYKSIKNPIEYEQRISDFSYTTAVNYPKGHLDGYEIEFRQEMGHFWDKVKGLSPGANATLIQSEVTLPGDEAALFDRPNVLAPMKHRNMSNAPAYLYNLFVTYDMDEIGLIGTQLGLFYTVKGDTLVAGAGQSSGNFVPNVYEKEYGTLNLSLSQKLGKNFLIKFQAKNLVDPKIQTVYRSKYLDSDVTKSSYTKGLEFTFGVTASF